MDYKYQGNGLTHKEKYAGGIRFNDYIENYPHLHKMSDLALLEELIFQEALHERIKEQISKLTKEKEKKERKEGESITDFTIPSNLQESLTESLDIQFRLKEKLGLFEDKEKLDAFRDFEQLKEDFREYRRRNPHLFKTTCPQCSFIFFLKRRTDCYEEIDSPWFKDKILCNPELWEAYKNKEITKGRTARILGVSEDYIDWLQEKIFAVDKKDDSLPDEHSLETLSLPPVDSSEETSSEE